MALSKPAGRPGPPSKPDKLGGERKARSDKSMDGEVRAGFSFSGGAIDDLPVSPDNPVMVGRESGPSMDEGGRLADIGKSK